MSIADAHGSLQERCHQRTFWGADGTTWPSERYKEGVESPSEAISNGHHQYNSDENQAPYIMLFNLSFLGLALAVQSLAAPTVTKLLPRVTSVGPSKVVCQSQ